MDKSLKYYIVQRIKDGKWINVSIHFIIQDLKGALERYSYLRETCPCEKYRIAKGKIKLQMCDLKALIDDLSLR